MKSHIQAEHIVDQYSQTGEQIDSMWNYLMTVLIPNQDLHGIMDWSADMREIVVKRDTLKEIMTSDNQ